MYAFVCVDDFFRYSWIHFIREKSNTFDAFEALILRLMLKKIYTIRRLYESGVIMGGSLRTPTLTTSAINMA